MSCAREPTYRLLDARVGWEAESAPGLTGLEEEEGLALGPVDSEEVSEEEVLPRLFPPWLAHGGSPCEWLLAPPTPHRRLLRWAGGPAFRPWGPPLGCMEAVASDCRWVAVARRAAGEVVVLDTAGRVRARLEVDAPEGVALAPWSEVLVAARGRVWRFGLGGEARPPLGEYLPEIVGMRADRHCTLWVAWRDEARRLRLVRWHRSGEARPATLPLLREALSPTGLRAWSEVGLCWEGEGPVAPCLDREGKALAPERVRPFGRRALAAQGTLTTRPLDSGAERTVWHRVRVEAEVPPGTRLELSVATLDEPHEQVPPEDWSTAPPGVLDMLCTVPPGRYLRLRLVLRGQQGLTPRVRQVRVDFPRSTSAELLPAVYLQEPEAARFTERFLSLFDAEVERLDRATELFPALLSVDTTHPELLPWLGSLMGLSFDPTWSSERRRALLREVPALWRARGTPWALRRVLELVRGAAPVLLERGNSFGAVGHTARLRATRLYGRERRRFRLDRSALGRSTLRSLGPPEADPFLEVAYRFSVLLPPTAARTPRERQQVEALVQALKPAHTLACTYFGGRGFIAGVASAVGVDTALVPVPPPVLGRSTRLSCMSVLWASAHSRGTALRTGAPGVGELCLL